MIAQKLVSISVDDGHPTDLRTAEMLTKHNLTATFYVPRENPEREVMTAEQIRSLAKHFDIGGHTLHHLPLHRMNDDRAYSEIFDGKIWLEDAAGRPARAFCYPQGKFNAMTPVLVARAGFTGARTCMFNLLSRPLNSFLWGLGTHAYDHSPRVQVQHALLEGNHEGLLNYARIYRFSRNWQQHFELGLRHVARHGGIAHLYFHSWEIDLNRQWDRLDQTLARIASAVREEGFRCVDNATLFNLPA